MVGAMISHVDDLYCTGHGEKYEQAMKELTTEIHLKQKTGEFRFCGKNVTQLDDGHVTLEQEDAIWALEYIVLDTRRRKCSNFLYCGRKELLQSPHWLIGLDRPTDEA